MSQSEKQGKQDADQSGVLLVEQKTSRPMTDTDQKTPTKQDVPGTFSDKPGFEKSDGTKSSKMDVKKKHSKTKSSKHVSSTKLRPDKTGSIVNKENSPETIPMTLQDAAQKKATAIPAQLSQLTPVQPISPNLEEVRSYHGHSSAKGKHIDEQGEQGEQDDTTSDQIAELRPKPRHSDWSDEEEAGGLPRSESRSSRVSRAVRQFFCCGLRCEPPDEDNVSHERFEAI